MSADNFIVIQKRKDKWHVWMDFAPENKKHKPHGYYHRTFKKHCEADAYAYGLAIGMDFIEYGTWLLPPKK